MTKSRAIITVESKYCQNSYENLWAQRVLPCIHVSLRVWLLLIVSSTQA